jgi:hypothetical protein
LGSPFFLLGVRRVWHGIADAALALVMGGSASDLASVSCCARVRPEDAAKEEGQERRGFDFSRLDEGDDASEQEDSIREGPRLSVPAAAGGVAARSRSRDSQSSSDTVELPKGFAELKRISSKRQSAAIPGSQEDFAKKSIASAGSANTGVCSTVGVDPDRLKAKEIEKASAQVATVCQKFPLIQSGFFGSGAPKERFVAAVPADEVVPDTDWGAYVKRWRRGKLGYWADKESYMRREAPKGYLDLMSVTKVSAPEGGTAEDVSVKHRDLETSQVQRLVLRFTDERKADSWRTALRTLRGLLQ